MIARFGLTTIEGGGWVLHSDYEEEVSKLRADLAREVEAHAQTKAALAEQHAEKDEAYRQRNHLVAALARIFPAGIRATSIEGWDAEWHGCCYIDLPGGQISYHYHDSQAHLFADLPPYTKPWDGHDKDAVHERLKSCGPDDVKAALAAAQEDAELYRWLESTAILIDPYDSGSNVSTWNWTIEIDTGRSRGRVPPADTPNFKDSVKAARAAGRHDET